MELVWQVDAHLKAPLPRPREMAPPSPRGAVYGVAHYRRDAGSAGQGTEQEAAEPRARGCTHVSGATAPPHMHCRCTGLFFSLSVLP